MRLGRSGRRGHRARTKARQVDRRPGRRSVGARGGRPHLGCRVQAGGDSRSSRKATPTHLAQIQSRVLTGAARHVCGRDIRRCRDAAPAPLGRACCRRRWRGGWSPCSSDQHASLGRPGLVLDAPRRVGFRHHLCGRRRSPVGLSASWLAQPSGSVRRRPATQCLQATCGRAARCAGVRRRAGWPGGRSSE